MSKIGIDEYDPEAGMSDSDWIKEKADQEDGCQVSVGGLTGSLSDAEMVRAAAERCMGWTEYDKEGFDWWADQNGPRTPRLWNPLTSDSECWELVDKVLSYDGPYGRWNFDGPYGRWNFTLELVQGIWLARFWRFHPQPKDYRNADPNRLRTLLIVCLRACGVEVQA